MELSLARSLQLPAATAEWSSKNLGRIRSDVWLIGAALVALILKLAIAYNTIGTNDVVFFYAFARALTTHSLEWTYQHSIYLTHPPVIAYYLRGIYSLGEQAWFRDSGFVFPFLV